MSTRQEWLPISLFVAIVGALMTLMGIYDLTHPNRTGLQIVGPILLVVGGGGLYYQSLGGTRLQMSDHLPLLRRVALVVSVGLIVMNIFPERWANYDGSSSYVWFSAQRVWLAIGAALLVTSIVAKSKDESF